MAEPAKAKCPSCRKAIDKRPRKLTPCPHCGVPIRLASDGKMYTEAGLAERAAKEDAREDAREQKEWFRDTRKENVEDVRDTAREEKRHRKEFNEPLFAGFRILVGPACQGASDRHGAFVPLEVAAENPDLLPPFPGVCHSDTCECRIETVAASDRVPAGLKVLNADGTSYRAKKAGCLSVLLLLALCVSLLMCVF